MHGRLQARCEAHPLRSLFRATLSFQTTVSKVVNQIKSLLPQTHPCLVRYTHANGLTAWVVEMLRRYPTTERLARARVDTLASIAHVGRERAVSLVAEAKATVGALAGKAAEAHMRALIAAYQSQQALADTQWAALLEDVQDAPDYRRLCTITGIGAKTACEIGRASCRERVYTKV